MLAVLNALQYYPVLDPILILAIRKQVPTLMNTTTKSAVWWTCVVAKYLKRSNVPSNQILMN